MADNEDIDIRVRLRDSAKFNAETDKSARKVDNLGDQAAQAARKFNKLSRSTSNARVNLGPFSTSVRRMPLWLGAAAVATTKWTGGILSLGEAALTVGGGGAAAGGHGLLALAQGAVAVKLGLADMGDALGGNEAALKRLTPEARSLLAVLSDAQAQLKASAQGGILPGLIGGSNAAMKNLPVVNKVIGDTGQALGNLALGAGQMVGSKAWGKDLAKIGATNVTIIENLGDAALHLADAGRHILVEAGPLAEWLSDVAMNGAASAEELLKTKDLAKFFREARIELQLLGSIGGHGSRGLINLFGAQDVDGTRTLRNFDHLMNRFEEWSKSPAAQRGVGQALIDEIPKHADDLAVVIANTLGAAAPMAAGIFWNSFWDASSEGKLAMAGLVALKTGAFGKGIGALGKGIGDKFGIGGGPLDKLVRAGKPLPVVVTNPGWGDTPTKNPSVKPPPAFIKWLGAIPALTIPAVVADRTLALPNGPSSPSNPNVTVGRGGGALPGRGAAALPSQGGQRIVIDNRLLLDGQVVNRNQRRINLQDKRRRG